jgi:hypothetical protein
MSVTARRGVRGHERVRTFGHDKSAPVAMGSPQFWPSDVLTETNIDAAEVLRWVARITGDEDPRYNRIAAVLTRR